MGPRQDHPRRARAAAGPRVQRLSARHRLLEVDPERLGRWVDGFAARHGAPSWHAGDGALVVSGADGAQAALELPWPGGEPVTGTATDPVDAALGDGMASPALGDGMAAPALGDRVAALAAHAARPRTALLVLVRRGGFAAGLARDGALLESATGTRRVQGRTAAGGWSQQRYARRRDGQARVLTEAAADLVVRVLDRAAARGTDAAPAAEVLVPGGDRALVDAVLADPRLRAAAALPRGPLLDVPDPRADVLRVTARRARAVRVRLVEPT